ncbi:MAG: universal stress protein [Bacteroidales bacterium]|nr:universal stress protein [Bacteroidales bacterium]MCF8301986.1 universal stress protein [Bacteroidales bacterium]
MEDRIINIGTFSYSRAQLLKARLEAEGIDCFLANVTRIRSDVPGGVNLLINEKDSEKALELIDVFKNAAGSEKEGSLRKLKQVRKIMVPVDFSEHSKNAALFALGIAAPLKAEIRIVHAYYNPATHAEPFDGTYNYEITIDKYVKELETNARKRLDEMKDFLRSEARKYNYTGLRVSTRLVNGFEVSSILQMSEEYKPGIIVLGTRGKNGKLKTLVGSVTTRVIDKAGVPVLVVPEGARFKEVGQANRVMYATDFDDYDFRALRRLMSFVRPFGMQVYCVHICCQATSPYDRAKMNELENHFKNEVDDVEVFFDIIESDNVIDGFNQYIHAKDIDLVSITVHKRNLIEKWLNPDITKKLLFNTNKPILIFHASGG